MCNDLKKIRARLAKNDRDCRCHAMRVCPDRIKEYWAYYLEDIEHLLAEIDRLNKKLDEAKDVLSELVDILDGEVLEVDSFTSQPARIFLESLKDDKG